MALQRDLLGWDDANARELPWRARPGETADPYRVWLNGTTSESIEEPAIVGPSVDHPFEITDVRMRKGVWIETNWRKTEYEGRPAFAIDVRNTRDKPGPYQDVLFIQTDHPERPEFKIRVEGRIE